MGDMADFALEQVDYMENLRFEYRSGNMSDHEAYDHGIVDEMGGYIGPSYGRRKKPACCKYCLTQAVKWNKFPDGTWRLQNIGDGKVHTCNAYKKKENE